MRLRRRACRGCAPIRMGLVGCGQEGLGLVHITQQMAELETAVIADIDPCLGAEMALAGKVLKVVFEN